MVCSADCGWGPGLGQRLFARSLFWGFLPAHGRKGAEHRATGKTKHLQTVPRKVNEHSQPPLSLALTTCPSPLALLREEVSRLQEEVHLLRQMKEMLMKDLEESQGGKSSEVLSATELRVQLAQKEQELARAKEALQGE